MAARAELRVARDGQLAFDVEETAGDARHIVDVRRVWRRLDEVRADVGNQLRNTGSAFEHDQPTAHRSQHAFGRSQLAVGVVDREVPGPARQFRHRLCVERREDITPLEPADQDLQLDEGLHLGHFAGGQPVRQLLNQRSDAVVLEHGRLPVDIALRVLRDCALRDAERLGDLPLGEPALAERLGQHGPHRREERLDDDLLDELHRSVANSSSPWMREAWGPVWPWYFDPRSAP